MGLTCSSEIDSIGGRVALAEDPGDFPRPTHKGGRLFQTAGLFEEELLQLRHRRRGASDNR
jgi:hypothetical protein